VYSGYSCVSGSGFRLLGTATGRRKISVQIRPIRVIRVSIHLPQEDIRYDAAFPVAILRQNRYILPGFGAI